MTAAHPRLLLLLALAVALLVAPPSARADVLDTTVAADQAVDRSCIERTLDGAGTAQRTLTADGTGWLTARLGAKDGDWDLAVFDKASGRRVAGSTSFGAEEIAQGFVVEGDRVVVQACRRSGSARTAALVVDVDELARNDERLQLVEVSVPNRKRMRALQALDLDLTEHGGDGFVALVLHGARDAAKLRKAGFIFRVEDADLVKTAVADRAADRRYARATQRSSLPSGRDRYRRLDDYTEDMKRLVRENPGLVKPITLPHKTYEGRSVEGIEITTDVNAADGKPVFLQMGVHHAREWPSGEHAMEWAFELVKSYKAGDARTRRLMGSVRTIVVPIVNPDGFVVSREAGEAAGAGGGRDEPSGTEYPNLLIPQEYQRKNCRFAPPREDEGGECDATFGNGIVQTGVDPNRNYGGFWGGPGASDVPAEADYHGPGPFSEPETKNVRDLVSSRHVTTLITNHTFSNLLLRPPAIAASGETPDEPIYKALGDSMAKENGYASQFSYQLYDTTGGTEDWTYYATGGLGFTYEIGPSHFHPPYADTVAEWEGKTEAAKGGGGNRAAYYKAMEHTADTSKHAVIEGALPEGTTLRLKKTFQTATSPQENGEPILFDDKLETTMRVGSSGRYAWHVNQSTRPVLRNDKGRAARGKPSPPVSFSGSPAGPPADGAAPGADIDTVNPTNFNDHPFEIPAGAGIDNAFASIRITWPDPASDWDMKVFRDTNGDGSSVGETDPVGQSGNGATNATFGLEEVNLGPDIEPGKFVARVVNYAATSPYEGKVTFRGPQPPADPNRKTTEAWTLSCERGGKVLEVQELVIERGERKSPDLSRCAAASARQAARECTPQRGFRSATISPRGRKARFGFKRRIRRPVQVDVFKVSSGRRVRGEILVARFRNKKRSFTWNGRANRRGKRVTDGHYFVRYRMTRRGKPYDIRRVTLVRRNGKLRRDKPFYRKDTCGLLRRFKLSRPVFGGTRNHRISPSFVVSARSRVSLVVRRGGRVVKRFPARTRRAIKTHRFRINDRGLPRGLYSFRITVKRGSRTVRSTLWARKL